MDDMQMDGGMQDGQQGQGGYCIEIYVGADGRPTSVNVETMEDENAEEQGAGMQGQMGMDQGDMGDDGEGQDNDKGVPVASLEEAMSMIKQIIQNQGQLPQAGAQQQGGSTEQDELMQGYGKGGIGARRSGLPVRKVFSGDM